MDYDEIIARFKELLSESNYFSVHKISLDHGGHEKISSNGNKYQHTVLLVAPTPTGHYS